MSCSLLCRRLFVARLLLVGLVALGLSAGLLPGGVGRVAGPGVAVAEEEPEEPPVPGQPLPPIPGGPEPDADDFVTEVPAVTWPASGVAEVAVAAGAARRAGALPVLVRAAGGERAGRSPSRVAVEALARPVVERAGGQGVAFRLTRADAGRAAGPVGVEVDYHGFRHAFGGDFASRLRLLRMPACALVTPELAECATGVVVPSRNDLAAGRLVAEVDAAPVVPAAPSPLERSAGSGAEPTAGDAEVRAAAEGSAQPAQEPAPEPTESTAAAEPAATTGEGSVFVLAADSSGSNGDFTATSLATAGEWEPGLNAGDFSYSYPLPAPPAVAGETPSLALRYSSGSVDGRTAAATAQGSWAGMGWELSPGFIERSYMSCGSDGHAGWGDLCYNAEVVTISLNGVATKIVQDGSSDEWRLLDDPGWKVKHRGGAPNGDNNGEYWVVTDTAGIEYYFGRGEQPQTGVNLGSVWTVPVFGDDAGEPCHVAGDLAASRCQQGWRWNLDYVLDPRENATTYHWQREVNSYLRTGTAVSSYDRGGWLKRVDYAQNTAVGLGGTAPARIEFTTADRCLERAGDDPNGSCPAVSEANGSSYPDVPVDLMCDSAATCSASEHSSPTFFTTKRLERVDTFVNNGADKAVDSVDFDVTFFAPKEDGDPLVWLDTIERIGKGGGGSQPLPKVKFVSTPLQNRLDYSVVKGVLPMEHPRIAKIRTELGADIHVSYDRPNPCQSVPPDASKNTRDCFPQFGPIEDGADAGFGWYHKYLVSQVRVDDLTAKSDDVVTSYAYSGGAAWHDHNDPNTPEATETWSQWRGYGEVTATEGSAAGDQAITRYTFFRGMHGDLYSEGNDPPTKTVVITDSEGGQRYDENWLRGRVREVRRFDADGTAKLTGDLHDYWVRTTAVRDPGTNARMVREERTETVIRVEGGADRRTEVERVFNDHGLPVEVYDQGVLGVGDNRCTATRYATVNDGTRYMVNFPERVRLFDGTCAAGAEVARTETLYDGSASLDTNVLVDGEPTEVRRYRDATGYVATRAGYDGYGRVVSATDARGNTTTTGYTPATGYPDTISTTNAKGHLATTTVNPRWGLPSKTQDPNGNVTEIDYDPLGRLGKVWLPTEPRTGAASIEFAYTMYTDLVPVNVVKTSRLQSGTTRLNSWSYYDTLARIREVQEPSPDAYYNPNLRMVTVTRYDSRGQVALSSAPMHNDTAPAGTGLLNPVAEDMPSFTRFGYDALGRRDAAALNHYGAERWRTTTTHRGDRYTVDPPQGMDTTYHLDAWGATEKVVEHYDAGGGAEPVTRYTYTPRGELKSIEDAKGNKTSYGYNWLGWRTSANDPDLGNWAYTYTANGDQQKSTNAAGQTLYTSYDVLNRPTTRRLDTATGTKLAEWAYDTASGGKGQLAASHRYTGGHTYTSLVSGYDPRGRPTGRTWTIPADGNGLHGSYAFGYGYDAADHRTSIAYPAAGGLTAETVTTTHDVNGWPTRVTSPAGVYLDFTDWSPSGLLDERWLGADGSAQVYRNYNHQPDTRRLSDIASSRGTTTIQNDEYSYDQQGKITGIEDRVTAQFACFSYAGPDRLARAWTTNAACANPPNPNHTFNPAPYNLSYSYDAIGNITAVTDHKNAVTRSYAYPASGPTAVRPHAVTAVSASTGGQDSYGYNANGSQTSRTIAGVTATLTWDQENRLAAHTKNGATTSYVYDADGTRLIRKDPAGATLYLDGMELRKTSTALTASRYYTTADGATIAVRTPTALSWLLTDHQASNTIAVNHATGALTRQRYTPYGAHRGTNATLPTDRGYLGKTEDDATGLLATDNRYYDPTLARFISVDPLADPTDPQTLNPYAYAANNPTTYSDPTGLLLIGGNNAGGYYADYAAQIRANGFESPPHWVTAPEPTYSMAWVKNR